MTKRSIATEEEESKSPAAIAEEEDTGAKSLTRRSIATEEESKSPTAIATARPTEEQIALKIKCQAVTNTVEVVEAVVTVEEETETDPEMETVDQIPPQGGHLTTSVMSDRPDKLVTMHHSYKPSSQHN